MVCALVYIIIVCDCVARSGKRLDNLLTSRRDQLNIFVAPGVIACSVVPLFMWLITRSSMVVDNAHMFNGIGVVGCNTSSGVSRGGPSRARPYLDMQNARPAISAIVHVHSTTV